ncbi:hypothetical protein FZEAL_8758 [Fusarium zealandicum]|uniref:Major facilitator superfamily (MFS) profile domain-containing protein n=1 Tax=Fusarium zealandicum TaxID=1053134 RepID=A0A8H4UD94_9HYPO|nr:hypothetical protein FZEAL_8758 [Fusarium zealandicum]
MAESPSTRGAEPSNAATQASSAKYDSRLQRDWNPDRREAFPCTPSDLSLVDENLEPRTARKWLKVLGGFFVTTATFGVINSIGLLLTHLEKNQLKSYSPKDIAWIAAANIFLAYSVPVLTGPIYDRYGPRWLLIFGTLCFTTGLLVMSFFASDDDPFRVFAMLMASWGLLCGVGTGAACTAITGTIYHTFNERRGLACGLVFTGCSLGGVVWPLMLRETLDRWGWACALRVLAGIVFVLLGMGYFLIQGGYEGTKNGPIVSFRCFRKMPFVFLTASLAVFQFVATSVVATLPGWGLNMGFNQNMMFYIISTLNAGAAVGRVTIGLLSDSSVGRINSVLLLETLAVVVIFGLFLNIGNSTAMFYAFASLWGFSAGAILSMMSVLVGQVCKKSDFGMYYGTNSLMISLAGLMCVPLGKLMMVSFGTTAYVALLGGLSALGVVLMGVARWAYLDFVWGWKKEV